MTVLAGIVARSPNDSLDDASCALVRAALSRRSREETEEFRTPHAFLTKLDIGAYGEPAFHRDASGSVSLLAGEPLLNPEGGNTTPSRTSDLQRIHRALDREDWSILGRAQGTFCAAHYAPGTHRLTLVTDKLGGRPLYVWIGADRIVFASAMRILECLDFVPKTMDVRSVTEKVGLGFFLGSRTAYAEVLSLEAGEVMTAASRVSRTHYWRWDDLPPTRDAESSILEKAYRRFHDAITRRLRGDRVTVSFLSGGLDSRCIVGLLRDLSVQVHTLNFAPAGTLDQVLGARFAAAAGTIHSESPMAVSAAPQWSLLMAAAWGASDQRRRLPPDRPSLVWSGDDGSVSVGLVYHSPAIARLLREGRTRPALDAYLRVRGGVVPRRLLRAEVAKGLRGIYHEAIREELSRLHCEDPARSFHLFLLLNHQRRHLTDHFEEIDLHRLEYQLPFFDGAFLETILAVPIDMLLAHRLYTKWLDRFPSCVRAVPWQAYPGHVPCPIPLPAEHVHQWDRAFLRSRQVLLRRELGSEAASVLRAPDFPAALLRRGYLWIAAWAHRVGIRDSEYEIRSALQYHRYWSRAKGRYVLNGAPAAVPAG